MKAGKITFALFSLLIASPTFAASCYPEEQAKVYVNDLRIGVDTFKGGLDLCNSHSQIVQFFQTLDFLRTTQLSSEPHPPFVRGILPTDYFAYLKERVRFINGPLRGCPMGIPASTCAGGLGEMIIGDMFYDQRLPVRASFIVHELRHLDGDFPHVTCTQGNEKGAIKGCDQTFENGATYAVQIEYLARLFFFAKNLSDDDRIAVKGFALYLAQNKFNTITLESHKAVVLIDATDGGLVLFDGHNKKTYSIRLPEGSLIARDRNFVVLPANEKRGKSYLFDPYLSLTTQTEDVLNDPEAIGWGFVEFNQSWTPERRASLLDSIRFGNSGAQAMLFAGHLDIVTPRSTKEIDLGENKIDRFVRDLPCAVGEISPQDLFGLGSDLHVRLIRAEDDGQTADLPQCVWPSGVRDYAVLDTGALALRDEGSLVRIDGQNRTEPVAELAGLHFRQMVRLKEPFYWQFMQPPPKPQ